MFIMHASALPILGAYHCNVGIRHDSDEGQYRGDDLVTAHFTLPAPRDLATPIDHGWLLLEAWAEQLKVWEHAR